MRTTYALVFQEALTYSTQLTLFLSWLLVYFEYIE